MKCDVCQGIGELVVFEHVTGDDSTDDLEMRPCERCRGTGIRDLPNDLAGRAPRIQPPAIPGRTLLFGQGD